MIAARGAGCQARRMTRATGRYRVASAISSACPACAAPPPRCRARHAADRPNDRTAVEQMADARVWQQNAFCCRFIAHADRQAVGRGWSDVHTDPWSDDTSSLPRIAGRFLSRIGRYYRAIGSFPRQWGGLVGSSVIPPIGSARVVPETVVRYLILWRAVRWSSVRRAWRRRGGLMLVAWHRGVSRDRMGVWVYEGGSCG